MYGPLPSEFKAAVRGALYQLLPGIALMLAGGIEGFPASNFRCIGLAYRWT